MHFKTDPLLVDIADYARSFPSASKLAYETAHYCLMDALACGFQALKISACTRLLGPVVFGATLTGGARVPGTSYELDPVNAAFNIGTMIRWLDFHDTKIAAEWGHPADSLGGILAVADYLSRSGRPVKVRDVLTAMIKAQEIQGLLAAPDRVLSVRVACTAVVAAMWEGSRNQIIDAVSNAWMDGAASSAPRYAGDVASRAVRHALFALKGEAGGVHALTQPLRSDSMEKVRVNMCCVANFETSVAAHFAKKQAEVITKMFLDQASLAEMAVADFVAKLVSAG